MKFRTPTVCAGIYCALTTCVLAFENVSFEVPGASKEMVSDLTSASLSHRAKQDGRNDPRDVLAAARADYATLLSVLYGYGHYGGSIEILVDGREAANIAPLSPPKQIRTVSIRVVPGPAFRFGLARITPLAAGTELPEGFVPGAIAPSVIVKETVAAGIKGWRDIGYAKVEVSGQQLKANHLLAELDVDITLDTGPRLTFGKLLPSGSKTVRTSRIHKIAGLPEGQIYSPEALHAAADRLRRTGSFSSVALSEAEEVGVGNTLDINAELVDAIPRRFGAGAELSTQEGLGLSGFWLHRNLLGGAERLRIGGEVSGIGGGTGGVDYKISTRFDRPSTFARRTALFLTAETEKLDEPDYTADQYGFGVGLSRVISKTATGELALEYRHSQVSDVRKARNFDLISLPVSVTWDRRDNALNPRDGFFLFSELRPFAGFGSTSSGLRAFVDGRAYHSLSDRLVWASRIQFGSVVGPDVGAAPPDYLFYSGGGGTVRGQSYQSLGIDLGGGLRRGGRSFVGLSTELRADVTDKIGVVGFFDAGFVGASSFYNNNGGTHSGIGAGLRYNTGIGPIRFDVGVPIGTRDGSAAQIYIGIGQAF